MDISCAFPPVPETPEHIALAERRYTISAATSEIQRRKTERGAYTLGTLLRRLVLPLAIQRGSLPSLQPRLFKTGGRLIRHARYFILELAERHLTQRLFEQILGRIVRLAGHPT